MSFVIWYAKMMWFYR